MRGFKRRFLSIAASAIISLAFLSILAGVFAIVLLGNNNYQSSDINVTQEDGSAHANISAESPYNSLLAYWNFDKSNSTTSYDFTHHNYNMVHYGNSTVNTTCNSGYNDCANFDGVNDYMEHKKVLIYNVTNFTFSLWVNARVLVTGPSIGIIAQEREGTNTGYGVQLESLNRVRICGYTCVLTAPQAYNYTNSWHHIVATGNDTNFTIYIDGVLNATGARVWVPNAMTNSFTLGKRPEDASNARFNGSLDEVMVFNISLNDSQVLEIFRNQSQRFVPYGTQTFSLGNLGNNDSLNVSLDGWETGFNSNISVQINGENIINISNGSVLLYNISSGFENGSLIIYYYSSSNNFYSPIVSGNITVLSAPYFPNVSFTGHTPSNNSIFNGNSITINLTSTDNSAHHFTLLDFDRSLIGWLRMDEINNTNGVADISTWSNNFTNASGAFQNDTGKFGKSFQFDGVNDVLNAPSGVYNFSINDSFTLMAWVYPFVKDNENSERGIMGRYTGATGSGYYYFTIDGTDGGGATDKLEFRMSGNNNTVLINQNANTTITNEQWTHVAVTYNGSQVILYKDGSIESGGNIATNAVNINSSTAFQVGAAGSSAFVFNGTIDEAMVFNTSLTQTQIQSIMNNQSSRFVYTGDVETRNINVSLLNENILNISIPDAERELGTNISLRLGEWDISLGYNNSDVNSAIPGLVSYWHLDNNSAIGENDTFVVDSMGRNNGTANHTVINNWGVFEKSHKFDDNSSHVIQVADSSSLNITTALTISGWIYRNRGGQAGDVILEHQPANGFYALFFEGNQIRFRLAFANSTTVTVSPTKLVTKGQWHHVVGTWNGTRAKVYLDGVNLGSEQNFFGSLAGKSGIVQIGRITSGSPRTNGSLDEIMIFNRSLTDNEVQELYVRGRALWSYGSYVNLSDSTRRYDYSSDCLNGLLMVFDNDENDICGLFQANLNSPGNWTNSNRGSLGNATLGIPSSTAGMYLTNDSQLAHLNNSFTLGTWVLAPYFGANSEAIIKIQDDSTKNFTQIDITSSNTLRALFDTSNRSSYAVTLSSASVTDGRWHYLALAYSANTKKAVLSVDGFRYNASSLVDGYLQFKSANITIGGRKGWYLDDISIWNRSLDEEEIIDIYSKTKHTRKEASFSITSDTTNVLPSWRLVTGPNNFYSPNVGGLLRATYDFQAAVDLTPTVSSVVLDSSSGTDTINENISVTFSQSGAGNINNITDWRLQNKSIAVLNMPFESNLSSTVKKIMRDYSTYNQNGTLGGGASSFVPVWNASGRVGGAYEFDGANDYINISGGNLSLIEGFSISSWVYLKAKPGTAGHWSSIVTRGIDGEGSTQNHNYLLGFANTVFGGTGFDFTIENSVGTNCDANTLDDEPTNKWYLLTGVFDSTAQRLLLYVNGTLQSNVSCTITPNTPALDVRIGDDEHSTGDSFNGTIDEVLIINRTISREMINFMYVEGLAGRSIKTILSQEISAGQNWSVAVTPNNNSKEGTTVLSNSLNIVSSSTSGTTCSSTSKCFFIRDGNTNVTIIDSLGNVDLKGSITESSVGSPDGNDFIVRNKSNNNVAAWIDKSSGNLRLRGTASENQGGTCTPPTKSFIVKNSTGSCILYIDSNGNLWSRGSITQNAVI